ncbi:MAG TPA: hypothetical protein VLE99_06050 [Candidatus Saccharimonadales bacterium]|nr:hypothetical protein [Candidatus Saccharimonadales bacterium]
MKRFFSSLSAALAVLLVVVSASPAWAAPSSSGLSISPRKNYLINPGQTVTDKLTVGNLSSTADLNLSLRMIDFTFSDQSGTPKLNLAANATPTPWSLKPFTTLPKTLTIGHGDTKTISYSITMPKKQGAGSYYSAILYQASGANGGNVALNASGVTLVFVSVPGTVKENLALQKFGAYNSEDNGSTGSFVFIDTNEQPKMVAYVLKNEGNVFESPAGSVIIKDMFGHTVATVPTNTIASLALLGQTRLFTSCIKTVQQKIQLEGGTSKNTTCTNPGLKPGKYTASLDVFYGQNGNETKEITAVASFWYLPWWFIILVLVILAALAAGIWWLQRKIKALVRGTTYHQGRGVRRK